MAIGFLAPTAIQQFFDANGDPLAGGKLYSFAAGTSVPIPLYSDINITIPLANPVILDAAGRAPELFMDARAYKLVLTSAVDVVIWTADNVTSPLALRSTQGGSSLTGVANDVPVPSGVITYFTMSNTSPVTITGFSGGTLGQILIIRAGNSVVHLQDYSVVPGSTPGNQLINFVRSGPTSLVGPKGMAVYIYVMYAGAPFWFLVTHEQGAAIRVPYVATNYAASSTAGTPTWVVDSADVHSHDYVLRGSTLFVTVQMRDTTVTGTPDYLVVGGFPYENTLANAVPALCQYAAGVFEPVVMFSQAAIDTFFFAKASGTWVDGTDTVQVFGQLQVDVL